MSSIKKISITLFLMFIFPAVFYSQNAGDALRLSEIGLGSNARALGMGNAYTALSDDFSASSFNPAGFALLKRMEFAGSLNYNNFSNTTTFFGSQSQYSNSVTKLDNISFAFPFPTLRGSLVFAVGYNRDRDFNGAVKFDGINNTNTSMIQDLVSYNDDITYYLHLSDSTGGRTNINGGLNQDGTILSKGSVGRWAFSGALEVARNMFFGGTLNVISGDFNRTREYNETDPKGIYRNIAADPNDLFTRGFQLFYFNDVLEWDITGWDANIGFLYQFPNMDKYGLRVGGNVKFPTSYTVKEKYSVSAKSVFAQGNYNYGSTEDNVEYDITTPYVFSGGASLGIAGFIVSGAISYLDYSEMEFSSSPDLGKTYLSEKNKDIKSTFRSVLNYNLGGEFTFPELDIRLRGGFMYNPSPYQADANTTSFDKKYVTGGIGFLADKSFAIDIAYAYGWWQDIGDNYGSGESRTDQSIKDHRLIFTISSRF